MKHRHFVLLLCGLILPTSPVEATTVLPLSLSDLVDRSDIVAHIRVGQVRIVDTPEAPFRVTSLEVVQAFGGQVGPGEVLELWQRGDGYVFVVGDPWLQTGEEGLAFLVREGDRVYLTALAQSWWTIESQGEESLARRDLTDLHVLRDRRPDVSMPPNVIPWQALREQVAQECLGVVR